MNENYLYTVIYFIMVDLDKTDVKCYDTEIIRINEKDAQVLFLLTKNNKNHCMLQNVYFYDDVNLAAELIKDNILLDMKYK